MGSRLAARRAGTTPKNRPIDPDNSTVVRTVEASMAAGRGVKAATKAIHDAEAALAKKENGEARVLVKEARDLIAVMPITEAQARAPEITSAFTGGKEKGARA